MDGKPETQEGGCLTSEALTSQVGEEERGQTHQSEDAGARHYAERQGQDNVWEIGSQADENEDAVTTSGQT